MSAGLAHSVALCVKKKKKVFVVFSPQFHRRDKTYFREPPKINRIALVIKAGFRALLVVRKDGDVGVNGPLFFPPCCACLSHHSPLHPACPVMSCITCSVVGMSCVRRLYSIFVP